MEGAGSGTATGTAIQVYGEVRATYPKLDGANRFKVKCFDGEEDMVVRVGGYCPVEVGDVFLCPCESIVGLRKKTEYAAIRPPLVKVGFSKHIFLAFVANSLRKAKLSAAPHVLDKLYDRLAKDAERNEDLVKLPGIDRTSTQVSYLARRYFKNDVDETLFVKYLDLMTPEQLARLFKDWQKRDLRKFFLMGLRKGELKMCLRFGMDSDQVYLNCLTNPYRLFPLPFEKCKEIADRVDLKMTRDQRRAAVVCHRLYEMLAEDQHTAMPQRLLLEVLSESPDPPANASDVKETVAAMARDYGVSFELDSVYLNHARSVEASVANFLLEIGRRPKLVREWSADRTDLSPDQIEAVFGCLTNPLSVVCGEAGTGKTTITREIVSNLRRFGVRVQFTSFTGKAVVRLKEVQGGGEPMTMDLAIAKGLPPFDFLVIDEASMVSIELLHRFFCKFGNGYRLCFIGDPNQLQPVQWGEVLAPLIDAGTFSCFRLKTVHRTNNDGILENTRGLVRNSTPLFKFVETANFVFLEQAKEVGELVRQLHASEVDPTRFVLLSPYKELDQPNELCSKTYYGTAKRHVDARGNVWRVGDKVMMRKNNYKLKVMNGHEGRIVSIDATRSKIRIGFGGVEHDFDIEGGRDSGAVSKQAERDVSIEEWMEDDEETSNEASMENVSRSFAITAHKSQGSEYDFVVILIPDYHTVHFNKKLLYVMLTRAKKCVWAVGKRWVMEKAAVTDPPYRCENLGKRLCALASN